MASHRACTVGSAASGPRIWQRSRTQVVGSLPRELVRQLRSRTSELRLCYERELRRAPDLAGRMVARFAPQPRIP